MKIKLCTTIFPREWRESFIDDGIKPGLFKDSGAEDGRGHILVQGASFPFHTCFGRLLVIEFWKDITDVFPDPDVWQLPHNFSKKELKCIYGAYVKEIKASEIIRIYPVIAGVRPITAKKYPDNICMYTNDKQLIYPK